MDYFVPELLQIVLNSEDSENSENSDISAPEPLSILQSKWGLGKTEKEYVSQNRNYEWYIDQMYTGEASSNNCGPSCAVMAAKWFREDFEKSVEDARTTFVNDGGEWNILNIYDFLNDNDIDCTFRDYINVPSVENDIRKGNILIVTLHTKDITYNKKAEQRIGKPYPGEFGHFIIIKGYRVVDDIHYFEVYDPYGCDVKYKDGTIKSKDRYYLAEEVVYSVQNWNPAYIAVGTDL
jgi:hypothetical protein